jgi:integrase/recombinase XerD
MKKNGYAETTIEITAKRLRMMAKHVNLDEPEKVKEYIAFKECSNTYKEGLVICYDRYTRFNGLFWDKPLYRREDALIKLPTEERINKIISSCTFRNVVAYTLLKECGLRPIELYYLTLENIDLDKGIVYVKTAKYGKNRSIRLKKETLAMLKTYTSKGRFGLKQKMFNCPATLGKTWQKARKRTALKFQDPEIAKIRLYDLRHFYGSMLYHKTKDLIYVKEMLGHKSISSTMRYMHLVNFVSDEWICKIAHNVREAQKLIESGFEHITNFEGKMLFRKRK